jgi:hypothetical protein
MMTDTRVPKYCKRCGVRLTNTIQYSLYDSYSGEPVTVDKDRLMCDNRHVEWRVNSEGTWFLWMEAGVLEGNKVPRDSGLSSEVRNTA